MKNLKIFIDLTRLNKPIGFMLLFWPCSWSLAYAYSLGQNLNLFLNYLFLFFLGSVLMRSAGCIFNDIVDRDIDKKVKRTRVRPIAAGKITIEQSLVYVLILCAIAFFVLTQFNLLTIILGMSSMLLAFSYPFMKRITYWPQLFLGITFNWGIIMAWTAMNNSISMEVIFLYVSAIFWTLGYDTIYGTQDMSDDEIIGVKSTSIKFKKNIKMFVLISYLITVVLMSYVFKEQIGVNIFSFFFIFLLISLAYQVKKFDKNNPKICLQLFKLNNLTGLIVFITILSVNL
jgi:4-hydroxybenzoate polyprenyltransferase|tara:strand:- start:8233 stop:9093 length:861 start_codon:yes stop_codon:yes gene_type:complete